MEIIDKKKFAKTALDKNIEAFVVHVTPLSRNSMSIHPAQEAQIALLLAKEVKIPIEYSDFLDVFSEDKGFDLIKGNRPELTRHQASRRETASKQMDDGFLHLIWLFQISKDAFQVIQCSGELSGLYQ